MIKMRVSEAARLLGTNHIGPDGVFQGCGIDSRVLSAGAMFIALRGQRRDGHDFVDLAVARGAAAAMVERSGDHGLLPIVKVRDCYRALGQLAAIWRSRFERPLIAITGSNGKTTVKELLAGILGNHGPTHATQGNLNNELGVPLTLLELDQKYHWAVVEMGANHSSEIMRLARMARPTVGVITRCAPAHLEGFGDIEGVARAKGELVENLSDTGVAVINADDPYAGLWCELAGHRRRITFGLDNPADVSADYRLMPDRTQLSLKTPIGSQRTQISLPGRHNVLNALAATAAAIAVGCFHEESRDSAYHAPTPLSFSKEMGTQHRHFLEAIATGLMSAGSVDGRLQIKRTQSGARIIDDTYNANPDSLAAAMKVLANYLEPRWLVLGDMGELGKQGPELHKQAGILARELGITRLFATGTLCRYTVEAFGFGGHHYVDPEQLLHTVRTALMEGATAKRTTILVKGSRHMRMERIADGLLV
uniref:UDP-N-acetylmuramoyl-tripeptide--D-alanyl-D-alanine ligase n=1 Tax=Candidatus Kentrum eta TaxID=2126337 RepID=A0A450UHC2_9GAMM|nr:MAG: UDP-N-acetylmuramoyl-tripeptide--D-alanyl-D-alanine ligase [Candidatus Kentron sp. H]VFJ91920.1 MAG: UDP-N-acetylmuramoyl-tripeptide--D-alanyl-D-alanine ligase [Candidatus Kentron sp. H]VFJ99764.1 MAG: UDP-N-acetylmuramoyl-tripeptide--D-alanyl-D-alanine ligase [Candidatus Kentron sp. H]